jgi:hypothetical protein
MDRLSAKKESNPVERFALLQISIGALDDSARKFVELAERQIEHAENVSKSTGSSIVSQRKLNVCGFGQLREQNPKIVQQRRRSTNIPPPALCGLTNLRLF